MHPVVRLGPLNRSQRRMWMRLGWRAAGGSYPALRFTWELPIPTPVAQVRRGWQQLVARHEILRTIFVQGLDNLPLQIVLAPTDAVLPISTADSATRREFLSEPVLQLFDVDGPPVPLWCARLFVRAGMVEAVTVVAEHMVTDGIGRLLWRQQFLDLCASEDEQPPSVLHPLDRVEHDADPGDPVAERAGRAAFTELVNSASPILVPPLDVPAVDRFLFAFARYDDLLPVLDRICRRNRCSRAGVLMFVVALMLAKFSRQQDVFLENLSANRRPGDASIDCQMLPVWQLVSLSPETDASTALKRCYLDSLRAYATGVIDEVAALEIVALTAARRGVSPCIPVAVNFLGTAQPVEADSRRPAGRAEVTVSGQWKEWGTGYRPFSNSVQLWIEDDDSLEIGVDVDTAMFPESTADEMIAGLLVAVDLLDCSPEVRIGELLAALPIEPCETGTHRLVGRRWVDLPGLERQIESCPGVHSASCSVAGDQLRAEVRISRGVSTEELRAELVRRTAGNPVLVIPDRIDLVPTQEQPLQLTPPSNVAQAKGTLGVGRTELAAAFEQVHGYPPERPGLSYVAAGGRLLLAPAVVRMLARRGLAGLRDWHFSSALSIEDLAGHLEPVPGGGGSNDLVG